MHARITVTFVISDELSSKINKICHKYMPLNKLAILFALNNDMSVMLVRIVLYELGHIRVCQKKILITSV